MRRYFFLLLAAVLVETALFAQTSEGKTDYNKKSQAALVSDYDFPTEAVQNAIIKKMEDIGNTAKEEKGLFNRDKGFIVFKNATVTEISPANMDYIIKVERKSRKESESSTLYLVFNKNGENAMAGMDAVEVGKAKAFLNNLIPDIEVANLELQIRDQEETVVKADKKFKSLQDDRADMEKKIKKLQDDLEKNAKDQEAQQKEVENQRTTLDLLKGKRKA